MKELIVLLLLPNNRLPSSEEHLDVLVEVSVLEELTVVLQEADQLLPGGGEEHVSNQRYIYHFGMAKPVECRL